MSINTFGLISEFVAHLQVLIAVAVVLVFLLDDVSIPDDVVREMVMQTIEEHDLPPLTGKRCCLDGLDEISLTPNNLTRPRIKYDYKWAHDSVLSDWMGAVPRFPDKQFQLTFRIKRDMVDIIINHLVSTNPFWTQHIDHNGKLTISPYVKFLCAMKMICYGVSGSAFIDYHQFSDTTSR